MVGQFISKNFLSFHVEKMSHIEVPYNNNPFQAIYIIDANSGLTLISKNYTRLNYDEDLISGLFRALESFVLHLAYPNSYERIQEINLQGMRIIYERIGTIAPILGVAITRKGESVSTEHAILKGIVEDFYQTYIPHLSNFKGNVLPFQSFTKKLNVYTANQAGFKETAIYPEIYEKNFTENRFENVYKNKLEK
jgi:hypothetical protein